jgi:hypothetical protein
LRVADSALLYYPTYHMNARKIHTPERVKRLQESTHLDCTRRPDEDYNPRGLTQARHLTNLRRSPDSGLQNVETVDLPINRASMEGRP